MHDIIILGGGPAGLTAGLYAARGNVDVLMLDRAMPGGQLNDTTEVENYPGFVEAIQGPELMDRMRKQAERFGLPIRGGEEVVDLEWGGKDGHVVVTDGGRYEARAVIVATGANPVELPAEGAERLKGRGLSYCATCDGFFFKNQNMLVVGGGDSALTEALFLTKFAREVRMVVRHPEDAPDALKAKDKPLIERAFAHEKIRWLWNTEVASLEGEDKLERVVLKDLSGANGGAIQQDDVGAVFVAIGHRPATGFLEGKLELDDHGYVRTDPRTRTAVPGVYAVGDVRQFSSRYAQAVIAAGDGCIAALEAMGYLEDPAWIQEDAKG